MLSVQFKIFGLTIIEMHTVSDIGISAETGGIGKYWYWLFTVAFLYTVFYCLHKSCDLKDRYAHRMDIILYSVYRL